MADPKLLTKAAYDAYSAAALCRFLADALCADPDTSQAGEAVLGIRSLIQRVSDDLHTLSEGEA